MSITRKILKRFGFVHKSEARSLGWSSGNLGRLLSDWKTGTLSVDSAIRKQLPVLRARCRDLRDSDDYAQGYVKILKSNVLGATGMHLRNKAKDPDRIQGDKIIPGKIDKGANKAIEEAWWWQCRKENCTVSEDTSWNRLENIVLESMVGDGEQIIRIVRGFKNRFRFALELFESDHLDTELNKARDDQGNEIRMGVELNRWRKPVAYWLLSEHPNDTYYWSGAPMPPRYERVPARDIIHPFVRFRPWQTRGVPWLATPGDTMHMLRRYSDYEETAAAVASSKMGFFKRDGTQEYTGDTDELGQKIMNASAGSFEVLPAGLSLEKWEPNSPNQNFPQSVKVWLRAAATALGISYNTLANDMESVNFASGKLGKDEERENFKCVQHWIAEDFHNEVFQRWLEHCLMFGFIKLGNGSGLPFTKFEKFNSPTWQGRRWAMVNPQQEMQALQMKLSMRLTSHSQVLAELGYDTDEMFQEISDDKKKMEDLDIMPQDIYPEETIQTVDDPKAA